MSCSSSALCFCFVWHSGHLPRLYLSTGSIDPVRLVSSKAAFEYLQHHLYIIHAGQCCKQSHQAPIVACCRSATGLIALTYLQARKLCELLQDLRRRHCLRNASSQYPMRSFDATAKHAFMCVRSTPQRSRSTCVQLTVVKQPLIRTGTCALQAHTSPETCTSHANTSRPVQSLGVLKRTCICISCFGWFVSVIQQGMFASPQGLDDVARAFAAKIQELQELTLLRVDSESPRFHLHSSQSVISQPHAVITGSAKHKCSLGLSSGRRCRFSSSCAVQTVQRT